MKKSFLAAGIALLITLCVSASMFAIGGTALFNKNNVPIFDSAAQATAATSAQTDRPGQLQALVTQYQDREQQYQAREQQLQQQLAQANAQIQQDQQTLQQVQMLLAALQQRGLIQLTNDGRVIITQ
jgi:peptidoglycan hydrolase CwlO-like protein